MWSCTEASTCLPEGSCGCCTPLPQHAQSPSPLAIAGPRAGQGAHVTRIERLHVDLRTELASQAANAMLGAAGPLHPAGGHRRAHALRAAYHRVQGTCHVGLCAPRCDAQGCRTAVPGTTGPPRCELSQGAVHTHMGAHCCQAQGCRTSASGIMLSSTLKLCELPCTRARTVARPRAAGPLRLEPPAQ